MENKIILSIIVPSYKETEKQLMPLLSSINNQVGIDLKTIEIIIIRDGTTKLDLSQFNLLDINIQQWVSNINQGPGMARQIGLNRSIGKYILFCDADDILHNVGILGAMIQEMDQNQWDILKTPWLEEGCIDQTQQMVYITHELENTWMHGKMFKHSFLFDNDIKFHPDLRVHEDTYFLGIATECSNKIGYLNTTSYVWKWGADSITRRNKGNYRFNSAIEFLKACTYVHEFIASRPEKYHQHLQYKIVQLILYHYFILHSAVWKEQPEAIKQTEQALVKYITPFQKYWTEAPVEYITKVYNEERNKHFKAEMETETLSEWLVRIGLI